MAKRVFEFVLGCVLAVIFLLDLVRVLGRWDDLLQEPGRLVIEVAVGLIFLAASLGLFREALKQAPPGKTE